MSRSLLSPVSIVFLPALLAAQRDVARAFPADAWAVAACAGLDAGVDAFDKAKLVGIARDLLGKEGWAQAEAMLKEQGGRDLAEVATAVERLGLSGAQVRQLLAGPFALGVGRPTLGWGMMPSIALVVDVGDAPAARDAIAALERLAAERAPVRIERATVQADGDAFTALILPPGMSLLHGVHDGHWLVGNSLGFLNDCLRALRGQRPSLASHESLARSRGRLAGARLAELFVNVRQFGPALAPFLPYEVDALGSAFGVTGMPDVFAGFAHDGKNAHDYYELSLPGPMQGMLKAPFARPISNRAAQWVKPGTILFASFSVDCAAAVEAGKRVLEFLPLALRREMERDVGREVGRELRRELGMTPDQLVRLLGTFGPEVSIVLDQPQIVPPFVTVSAFVQVRDQAHAEATVRELLARDTGQAVQTEEVDGIKTWSVEVHMDNARITPTLGLRDGWLVFSNFKNVARRLLTTGPLGEKALAADPRFTAAANTGEGAVLFVTGRLQPLLDAFWGLAATSIRSGASFVGVDTDMVPDAEEMADAVDDLVLSAHVTEEGFALRVQQPLGFGAILPALAAGFDWLLRFEPVAQAPRATIRKPAQQKIY